LLTGNPVGEPERVTTTVLENITVLSTAHKLQPNADGQPENVPVVNMLLNPEQAELLTLATQEGRIQLILRNPNDTKETAEDRGVKRARELFFKGEAPKPVQRAAAPRPQPQVVKMQPAPPPPIEVEMIRGNQRSVETINAGAVSN
jgi:pilus assembly protein CpaB